MQARFACVQYGFEENANLVGAINILAAEHAALTCGGTALSGRPAKREPKRLRRSLLLFSAVGIAFLQVARTSRAFTAFERGFRGDHKIPRHLRPGRQSNATSNTCPFADLHWVRIGGRIQNVSPFRPLPDRPIYANVQSATSALRAKRFIGSCAPIEITTRLLDDQARLSRR